MPERPTCAVPGCDHPDRAGGRYVDFCPVHGRLVADFHVWIESDEPLAELAYLMRLDAAKQRR